MIIQVILFFWLYKLLQYLYIIIIEHTDNTEYYYWILQDIICYILNIIGYNILYWILQLSFDYIFFNFDIITTAGIGLSLDILPVILRISAAADNFCKILSESLVIYL